MILAAFFAYASTVSAGGLAAASVFRARRQCPRWAFAASMAALAAEGIFLGLALRAEFASEVRAWQQWRLVALSFAPISWLLFSATYARGAAKDHVVLARWPLAIASLVPVVFFLFRAHALAPVSSSPDTDRFLRIGPAGTALHALVLVSSVLAGMNLERTFRDSVGTMRWRIKFMLLGVGVLLLARIYTSSQALVFGGFDVSLHVVDAAALLVATPLILRSWARAGHFHLQVYPSQSVLQSSVTALLAGIYLLILGAFAKTVAYFGGDAGFALKAFVILVALVVLAITLQSDRARLRVRRFVSLHFKRPSYDYRIVWAKFAAATTTRVDHTDLARAVAALIADVFQSLSVSIWLVNDRRDALLFLASTSSQASPARVTAAPISTAIAHLQGHLEPVDIDGGSEDWAESLRDCHPNVFSYGGHRVCQPLVSHGELFGLILIGDRVGGAPFDFQDLEMLRCVGDHVAASLMNLQLSQKLLQARELEAFQAMAAFFVHDLKNSASTLSLMLENLPLHFDNPQFRADALRGVGKTVTHINRLISRLSALRHELRIDLVDTDLNDVVEQSIVGMERSPGLMILRETSPLPRIPLDREQITKVITNLVLNAAEALPSDGGRIRIATAHQGTSVVLTVEDNGCGMHEEFLRHSLFRPFQTTKNSGLGIGMFQSKTIVEAHGGRILVASEPGKGTTIQILFRGTHIGPSAAHPPKLPIYETETAHRR